MSDELISFVYPWTSLHCVHCTGLDLEMCALPCMVSVKQAVPCLTCYFPNRLGVSRPHREMVLVETLLLHLVL